MPSRDIPRASDFRALPDTTHIHKTLSVPRPHHSLPELFRLLDDTEKPKLRTPFFLLLHCILQLHLPANVPSTLKQKKEKETQVKQKTVKFSKKKKRASKKYLPRRPQQIDFLDEKLQGIVRSSREIQKNHIIKFLTLQKNKRKK